MLSSWFPISSVVEFRLFIYFYYFLNDQNSCMNVGEQLVIKILEFIHNNVHKVPHAMLIFDLFEVSFFTNNVAKFCHYHGESNIVYGPPTKQIMFLMYGTSLG